MVANPYNRRRYVSQCFSQFTLANCKLSYVSQFKYLGHIIEHTFCDNSDVNRELRNLFASECSSSAFFLLLNLS